MRDQIDGLFSIGMMLLFDLLLFIDFVISFGKKVRKWGKLQNTFYLEERKLKSLVCLLFLYYKN